MYHDQGLPVLKYSGFEQAVNLTLGLPYPRVAVDHGTALDLAGRGIADPSSLFAAVDTCARASARADTASLHEPRMSRRSQRASRRNTSGQHFLHDRGDHRQDRAGGRSEARRPPGRDRPGPGRDHLPAARPPRRADRHRVRSRPDRAADRSRAQRTATLTIDPRATCSTVDFTALARRRAQIRLVGNLPYNLSSPILFHALDHADGDPRHALHAAEGSGRPHGRRPGQQGLRPPERDAAGLLPRRRRCSTCRRVRSGRRRRSTRRSCAWCRCARGDDRHRTIRRCSSTSCATPSAQRRKTLRNALSSVCDADDDRGRGHAPGCARRAGATWPASSRWPNALAAGAGRSASTRRSGLRQCARMTQHGQPITPSTSTSPPASSTTSPRRDEDRYVFAYTIRIRNRGKRARAPARPPLGDHRRQRQGRGSARRRRRRRTALAAPRRRLRIHLRRGAGNQPSARCAAATSMLADDGTRFDAPIPAFTLSVPRTLH